MRTRYLVGDPRIFSHFMTRMHEQLGHCIDRLVHLGHGIEIGPKSRVRARAMARVRPRARARATARVRPRATARVRNRI